MARKDDWQHPYVNIFKEYRVSEWQNASKVGDVSPSWDKTINCSVFRIRGPVPAENFILIPKNASQSLGLKGRYLYLLFKPTPRKPFLIVLDVGTENGRTVRISISNMFKEFDFTPTSLLFPIQCKLEFEWSQETAFKSTKQCPKVHWTCLMMDLQLTLATYLNRLYYSHLKSIKLCSNMSVKNVFTTDLQLTPELSYQQAKYLGLTPKDGTVPMPRDMMFPVPMGHKWEKYYNYIRFPLDGEFKSNIIQKISFHDESRSPSPETATSTPELPEAEQIQVLKSSVRRKVCFSDQSQKSSPEVVPEQRPVNHTLSVNEEGVNKMKICKRVRKVIHVMTTSAKEAGKLLPDPILRLRKIIGFGGATNSCALWTLAGDSVIYPCHAIVVSLKINSCEQRFFIGHTDKVSALAFNGNTTLLVSAQTGNCVVRIWNYLKGNCVAMFKMHAHSVTTLSFSHSGGFLCGGGKDSCGKTLVVVWNTTNIKNGDVSIFAKLKMEVDIQRMKFANFDETRLVSCGHDSIRLWRVNKGTLRSCAVNLGEYRTLDFTDVAFEEGDSPEQHIDDRLLFASSRSGHIFEIDYSRVVIKNVRWLFPVQQKWSVNKGPGIAINSLSVCSTFCATGSEDGFLRLWPLDFSGVFLEAEHEGPVSLVSVSSDSMQVLSATSTGNLGFLDVSSRGYNTLMRSHTSNVLGFSVDGIRRHLTTASSDGSIRIWSMDSLHQLYDFVSEDKPCSVAFHPREQIFSCGFNSGIVRVFDISCGKLLAEHNHHKGLVVGLAFSPDGECMYSAASEGSLALYNSCDNDSHVIRVVCRVVARGTGRAPDALTVSSDSRCLAFVGPTEYVITIADALSLEESLRLDVSVFDPQSTFLDSALKVCFSVASPEHLLVTTSANKILWVNTQTGSLFRQVCNVHTKWCTSLAVSQDKRFLVTAGDNAVKVWDYNMKLKFNSQMFIGHSQPINQVSFTPGQKGVISVGDAIFLWDFLAHPLHMQLKHRLPLQAATDSAVDTIPRQRAPQPLTPPPHLDGTIMDPAEIGLNDINAAASGPSSRPESAASFLKITELGNVQNNDSTGRKTVRPDCYKHFVPHIKTSILDQTAVTPQPDKAGMTLKTIIGYNGNGRGNLVWSPDQGLFAYSCGGVVVVENVNSGRQRHLVVHREEISCLAISNNAKMIASAASKSANRSLICIWAILGGACVNTISYHKGAVQSLAFSSDDRFLLSVGDFSDCVMAVWSCSTFEMLSKESALGPIHDAAFSPSVAAHLACVGSQGVYFGLFQNQGGEGDLNLVRVKAPTAVGDVEMTALCFHADDALLFTASNRGHLCIWDIKTRSCFMAVDVDEGEIGVLLCRGNRLLTGSDTQRLRLWGIEAVRRFDPEGNAAKKNSGVSVMLKQEIVLDGAAVSAAFDNTMDMGIVGTTTGTLWYIDWLENSSIRLVSGHKNKVNDLAFQPDESHFATCSEDGSLRVWSIPSNELVVQFQVLNQACTCVSWSPFVIMQRARLVAGYNDGTVRVFRLATSEMERKLNPHRVAITAIQYSANGEVILSGAKNGLIAVSRVTDGSTIRVFKDHKKGAITTIECVREQCKNFGVAGNELWLAASLDRRVSVWAADWFKSKCNLLDWLTLAAPPYGQDDSPPPSLAAFHPTDPSVIIYTGYGIEKELTFYSLKKKRIIKKIALPHWATCFSLSPKSQLIALGSKERVLKLIKWSTGEFQDFLEHSDSLQKCRFSPSGTFLFSVAHNEILIWEVNGL
ncbi:WD repeat-containing protein 90 isoform X2 [Corythoichthys intestinalis]|uniref:WD repeat-containing protein 90 isoform X2 n=1 Tax=Corythoichthys intestinalis TaxID=161448 RepID=UPI0025A53366|nr:WD repeat-containing protein 90 isoform X2 [Corythoichthys intestinalis]